MSHDFSAKWSTEAVETLVETKLEKESVVVINAVVAIHNAFHTIQQKMNVAMKKSPVLGVAKKPYYIIWAPNDIIHIYDSMNYIPVSILNHFSYSVQIRLNM